MQRFSIATAIPTPTPMDLANEKPETGNRKRYFRSSSSGNVRYVLFFAAMLTQQFNHILIVFLIRIVQRRMALFVFGIDLGFAG
jgi:hypothetical protein